MTFKEALKAMKRGAKVRLPGWLSYYWYWDEEKETVMTHSKPLLIGCEEYETDMLREDWMIANEENCPIVCDRAVFSFGDAIAYLKKGRKVARKGWNGKKQYIQLATGISYKTADGEIVNCEHDAIGNMAIAFVGTSGVQMGWLASQADMLAEDWVFAE